MSDIALPLLASIAATLCFYLSAPRQQWLSKALPGHIGRLVSGLLLAIAYLLWQRLMHGAAAFFVLLTIVMLLFAIFPALSLLKAPSTRSKA